MKKAIHLGSFAYVSPLLKPFYCSVFKTSRYRINNMNIELVFEGIQEKDGGFAAECLFEDIFIQADTWEELRLNVRETVSAYFFY